MRLLAVHVAILAGVLASGQATSVERSAEKRAKKPACSIRASEDADPAALRKMAKVTRADALTRAESYLAPFEKVNPSFNDDPQVEGGCVVWSFGMTVEYAPPKKPQFRQFRIHVDAGNGNILSAADTTPDWMKE